MADEDVDLEPDKSAASSGSRSSFPCGAKLESNGMPLHIAKLLQSFPEFLLERLGVRGSYVECAYSSHLGLLRPRRERPRRRCAAVLSYLCRTAGTI